MRERLTHKVFGSEAYIYDDCIHERPFTCENKICYEGKAIDRLAAYEDSGLSPEQVQELAQAKAEGRLKILKAALFQTVWFYDGANRLMQGKVIEYLDCGNGLIYQVQGAKKGLWLHECEIFLSREEAEKALGVGE